MKQFILEILDGLLATADDNRNRIRLQYDRLKFAETKKASGYGDSDQTLKQDLDVYESYVVQLENAINWLQDVTGDD